MLTRRFVQTVHGRNMAVHVRTVNDMNDMRRMVYLDVDGVISDYPDRLKVILSQSRSP